MADYFIINFNLALDNAVPSETFVDAFAGAGEKFFSERWIAGESFERVSKSGRVFFGNENSGFSVDDDIGDAADIACHDGQSKLHGFDEHDAESFGVALAIDDGWERKDVCRLVFVREVFRRKLAREDDRRRRFFDSTKIDWILRLHFVSLRMTQGW